MPAGRRHRDCVARMGGVSGVSDPDAICQWMRDEGTGFYGSEADTSDDGLTAAVERYNESVGGSSAAALQRGGAKREARGEFRSLASLAEAVSIDEDKREVRCVVITEGLGNKRDRHYYGPEAVDDIAGLVEGSKAYINHQTDREFQERPEGSVWELAGFWKDSELVDVQTREGMKRGVIATLCCDTSPAGDVALAKARHALSFAREFPNLNEVYAGISINGDGEIDRRELEIPGEGVMEVNYVTRVTALPSADVVTRPAREGRFLNLVESMRSASTIQEALDMNKKALKEARGKIAEAMKKLSEGGLDAEEAKALTATIEAEQKKVDALVLEAAKTAAKKTAKADASEAEMDDEDEDEDADEADGEKGDSEEAMRAGGKGGYEGEDEADDEDDEKGGGTTKVKIKHEETMTKKEAVSRVRDLEKQLAESNKELAALRKSDNDAVVRQMVEEGIAESVARSIVALPKKEQKAMRAVLGLIQESGVAGATSRGVLARESKPGESFMKLLEAGDSSARA